MKKFLNTMLVTAAVVAVSSVASFADAGAKPAQGAYVGVSGGVANTNVKYSATPAGAVPTVYNGQNFTAAQTSRFVSSENGKSAGIFGLVAGYNFQSGSMVFGAEIYGGFDSTKVKAYDDSASGNQTAALFTSSVKRTQYFGFAPRIGFMVAPNTLLFARLGVEAGAWKATVIPNPTTSTVVTTSPSSSTVQASKKSYSFAPGAGMEVYLGKVFLRAQYSYLFGPTVKLNQSTSGYSNVFGYNGTSAAHSFKVTQHKVEVAVGYKF